MFFGDRDCRGTAADEAAPSFDMERGVNAGSELGEPFETLEDVLKEISGTSSEGVGSILGPKYSVVSPASKLGQIVSESL